MTRQIKRIKSQNRYPEDINPTTAINLAQCIQQLEASLDHLTDDIQCSQSGFLKLEGGPIARYPAFCELIEKNVTL